LPDFEVAPPEFVGFAAENAGGLGEPGEIVFEGPRALSTSLKVAREGMPPENPGEFSEFWQVHLHVSGELEGVLGEGGPAGAKDPVFSGG
jgi:hypothetical protein